MAKKFLTFQEIRDTGRTKVWAVLGSHGGQLGTVQWFSHWRRYVFAPGALTIYDQACLDEITSFIDQQMAARKA